MAISRTKKEEIYAKVGDIVDKARSVVFVNFYKLPVSETLDLRRKLRKEGVGYTVAKKTLIKRAFADKKIEGDLPELGGELALAYGDDLIVPAREVYSFQKTHKDNLSILGGIFEGKFVTKESMLSIATIPSQKVLYGQFVNLINTPIQQFVMAIDQIAKKKEA